MTSNPYSSINKPLLDNGLLSNDTKYEPIYISNDEEMNYHSIIQKLINRTKNVEAEILRNYNHGMILFNEFFRLLETTEMVAFDIMYVDCLWGEIEFMDFYDFIQKCHDAIFLFDRPTEKDIQVAAEHIRYLHSIIHTCCNDFRKFDPHARIDPPQRPYKIYAYLEELTKTIEDDILKFAEIKKHEQAEIEYDYGFDASIYNNTTLPKNSEKFNEWLVNFVQPNHDSNQNIAPNRSLLGKIFHKMNVVQNLKEEAEKIKQETISPQYMQPLDFDPQDIQNSPYFKAAMGNASFLRLANDNFLSEHPEIDICETSIENSYISFSKLHHPCQETLKAVEKIHDQIRDRIAKEQKELKDLNKEIIAYYDLFLSDSKIDRIYKLIDDITNLDKEITTLFESEQSKQKSLNNTNAASKISDFISILQELSDLRAHLFDLCKECAKERKDELKNQRKLFTLVADFLVHKEKQHNYERYTEVVTDHYKSALDDVFKLFNKEPVLLWCRDVNAALDEMEDAVKEHDRLTKLGNDEGIEENINIENNNYDNDIIDINGEDEIRKLELEIEQLEQQLSDVNSEKIHLQEEVNEKEEILFDQIQMNDMYIIYQGSNRKKTEKLKDYKEAIICSICKERLCDVVINKKSCNHTFCKSCIELDNSDENGQCPICGTHYNNESLLEFTFNPKKSS